MAPNDRVITRLDCTEQEVTVLTLGGGELWEQKFKYKENVKFTNHHGNHCLSMFTISLDSTFLHNFVPSVGYNL